MDTKYIKEHAKTFFLEGLTSYVSIAVGMLIVLAAIGITTVYLIKERAREMTAAHVIQPRELKSCGNVDTPEKLLFVNGQRAEIVNLGNQHRENAIVYFAYFYTTYLVLTIFGLIAAMCLAVITKSGINGASGHV